MTSRELLKRTAFSKRHPEWEDDLKGANIAIAHAHSMLSAGKLTQREFKEYESHLWSEMLEKMPLEVFSEMQADGSLNDLEALAHGNNDRDSDADWKNATDKDGYTDLDKLDPVEVRKAIDRKVKADALEMKWLDGTIDDQKYAQLSRDHVGRGERLDSMIADGKHHKAAQAAFERQYEDEPDHDNDLVRFLVEKYGDTRPDGSKVEMPAKKDSRSNLEKATDKNGVIDMDMLADLENGNSVTTSDGPAGYVEHETVHDLGSILANNQSDEN
ncbi:hypothetical protein JQ580_04665 [Bradyrhizobium japonicum]|uniref:hypothetical protein n=1 Tax=Bradyrhizobium japonicum TaxID=375 RepID=UPI001BAE13C4|nr:hypothetical protein [Bradyrhizobium japonicum]MBR0990007.1 hypothetical protein [Bradyrhizobium japonicum]